MACNHKWRYYGGVCKCDNCKKYLQPDGRITDTPTGRTRKPKTGCRQNSVKGRK